MADIADAALEAAQTTPGDEKRDEPTPQAPKPPAEPVGDAAPKRRGRPKGSKNAAPPGPPDTTGRTKAWIAKRLASMFTAPGFAFELMEGPGCWPAEHVGKAGPDLANEIARYAERNPPFKARLVTFLEGGETAGLVFAAAMYVLPLGMYFGVVPAPPRVKAILAVPERGDSVPADIGPSSPEDLLREAQERGYEDVGEYMTDVQEAISNVRREPAAPVN